MKLDELVGVKSLSDKTKPELIKFLDEFTPLKKLGIGYFATVFGKGDTVYKFWIKDPGYEAFVKYVQDSGGKNKHLPRFKSGIKTLSVFWKRHKDLPDKIKYIKMEKLDHVINDFDWSHHHFAKALNDYANGHPVEADYLNVLKKRYPDLESFIQTCMDVAKALHSKLDMFYFDTNAGNYLKRGDEWVLTDPSVDETALDGQRDLRSLENYLQIEPQDAHNLISGRSHK